MRQQETAIMVALWKQGNDEEKHSLQELEGLAKTAGIEVITEFTQNRSRVDNRHYIGRGKTQEIGEFVQDNEIDIVLFDTQLSPTQVNNLEQVISAKIIDRSELILDIFAQHARSSEGKLQVELAQLQYQLPKLMGRGRDLSRLAGGIGTRGPGETKLEVDRRHIRRRIHVLEEEIAKLKNHRQLLRKRRQRHGVFQVALVGYTNSGKSTLLNQLTQADTYVADALFATLDPLSRKVTTDSGTMIISDTVGFISGLPHHLVAAFKATLEVVTEADLLIHVVDASQTGVERRIGHVNEVLEQLGCSEKEQIIAANKTDLLSATELDGLEAMFRDHTQYIPVSAQNGANCQQLLEIVDRFREPWVEFSGIVPQQVFQNLSKSGYKIQPLEFTPGKVRVKTTIPQTVASTLKQYDIEN